MFWIFSLSVSVTIYAQPKLPKIFSDHMVIQRQKPIHVWGTASKNEKITVTLNGKSASGKADRSGNWLVTLPVMDAGGPYTLEIRGKSLVQFNDVMLGDIWLCSGQSNMEWPVSASNNAKEEIASANYPMIRHFKVPNTVSLKPLSDLTGGEWQVCSPSTVGNFTAVGYFFARDLLASENVAIGLLNSSWGGTHVETWTSGASFFAAPEFASLKPKLPTSFDDLIADRQKKAEELLSHVQGTLPSRAEVNEYKMSGYNDDAWAKMKVPGLWNDYGLGGFDGEIWFRQSFSVPADISLANVKVRLGKIDDTDSTFINGVFIGATNSYSEPREYKVPPGVIKGTGNEIVVKINDTGGGGGMYGEADEFYIDFGVTKFPLEGEWKYRIEKMHNATAGVDPNAYPTLLYNAMINPLLHFNIKGAIWYQGESNAGRAQQYRTSFPLMIEDWRKQWKDEFPFYFVQLTNFQAGGGTSSNGGSEWAELREAQASALRLPNTGMAVIIDIGESKDIHPRNKQDVGKRLAAIALAKTYNKSVPYASPEIDKVDFTGTQAKLHFKNVNGGWKVDNKYGYINGFELAGTDKQWHYARAWIENGDIIVMSEDVKSPVAVRYAWADDPSDLNLFDKTGLPASPFRSDSWAGKTDGRGFNF